MSLQVNGKTIEIDEEGYLLNLNDWNEEVAIAIATNGHIDMTESHWALVEATREYYQEKGKHPWGNDLVHILGRYLKESPHEKRHDVNAYLYQLFSSSPEAQLAKIAGLPKPLPTDTNG